LWDLSNFRLIRKIEHGTVIDSVRSKDEKIVEVARACGDSYIVVGFMNGDVGIYDLQFLQPMNKFGAHGQLVMNLAAAKRQPLLATCSHDQTIKIWSLRGVATCKRTLLGHRDFVLTVCFANKEQYVLSGAKDETIRLWNHENGHMLFTIRAHRNTLFEIDHHPRENCFASCSGDGLVCVWKYSIKP
jgi:WD40 repeat protein